MAKKNLAQEGVPDIIQDLGINMPELINEFRISDQYTAQFSRDFVLLDSLVDGVPLVRDDGAPFVGDTTMAGLVRSIPRASLKQLPVLAVTVNGNSNSLYSFLCTYLLKETAFNEDTFGKGLLSTLQLAAEQALSHGYAPMMVASGAMYNDFGTTLRLLHYSDVGLEPGVFDSNESGYYFVKAHITPGRMRRILRKAESNENTSWNVPALRQLLQSPPVSKDYTQYQTAPRKASSDQGLGQTYEIVTRYETGPNSNIITFSPDLSDGPLRVIENKSKWGYPRVQFLVIDPAALSPFGISRVRLASPNQNFMNIYYANIAAMLLLNSNPPLFKKGTFTKPTNLKRGAIWETLDPNADISLKTMDNGALSQFVPFSQQFSAQIQNIMGGQTMSVNAGSKTSQFGKTAPGVEAGQAFASLETNQITNILENFLRQYALVALDTLFSEMEGDETIIVDDETKNNINQVAPGSIGDNNAIEINWDVMYDSIKKWSVKVEVSLSPDELKEQKHRDLQDILVVLAQNAESIPGAAQKVQEITNLFMQDKAPTVSPMNASPMGMVPSMDQQGQEGLPV